MDNASNANAMARDSDRIYVGLTNNFVPSNNYRPRKGKRRQAHNQGQKRKAEEGTSKPTTMLKDVILLPPLTIKEVPRSWKRKELYNKNFAVSTVEISKGMDEAQI